MSGVENNISRRYKGAGISSVGAKQSITTADKIARGSEGRRIVDGDGKGSKKPGSIG